MSLGSSATLCHVAGRLGVRHQTYTQCCQSADGRGHRRGYPEVMDATRGDRANLRSAQFGRTFLSGQARSWAGEVRALNWRRDLLLPVVLCIFQFASSVAIQWHRNRLGHVSGLEWALLGVGPLALAFRRRHPAGALLVTFASTLGPTGEVTAYFSLIVAFFVAATTGHRRAAWASIVAGYAWSTWLSRLVYGGKAVSVGNAITLAAFLVALVVGAEAVRISRERRAEALAARQLDARRQASEERLRMARDLHDVIGHNISLINVQAGVGLDLMERDPEQTRAALAAIKAVSKEALGELRAMLDTLRQSGDDAPRSPVPGLSRLDELVELTRAAGLPVTLEITGEPRRLPATVDVAAYRIVQESLTNVTRHAPGSRALVHVSYEDQALLLDVVDSGARAGASKGSAGAGTGSGIAGMRERARAVGGELTAGPDAGGGFAVRARLPLGDSL